MANKESIHVLNELLESAGIKINGSNPWDITINDPRFYSRVLQQPHLALGEGYMDGWWDCPAIDQFVTRVLKARLDEKVLGDWRIKWHILRSQLFNLQNSSRAFQVGQQHYDLGNDLYQAMLDRRLTYSCGYWKNAKDLNEAQEAKLDLVCRKIGLQPGMSVLDLGCGWGSFAKYAAEKYGVSVLGVTVSKEQLTLGTDLCKGLPIELRLQDYREVEGKFDRVISIGSFEHIGYKNYHTYMQVTDRCLKEGGFGLIHSIGSNISTTGADQFTNKYIFPNGMLPSIQQIGAAMEGLFVMEDWHNFGPYYDPTLMAWHANFETAWPDLKKNYSERFHRMWNYYLLSSAGGFRSRSQQLWQIVFTRPGTTQPDCRMV
jgi:cyclopropane-fatty-acyl-phospholipid synthase